MQSSWTNSYQNSHTKQWVTLYSSFQFLSFFPVSSTSTSDPTSFPGREKTLGTRLDLTWATVISHSCLLAVAGKLFQWVALELVDISFMVAKLGLETYFSKTTFVSGKQKCFWLQAKNFFFCFRAANLFLVCENSRPSSLPARVAFLVSPNYHSDFYWWPIIVNIHVATYLVWVSYSWTF